MEVQPTYIACAEVNRFQTGRAQESLSTFSRDPLSSLRDFPRGSPGLFPNMTLALRHFSRGHVDEVAIFYILETYFSLTASVAQAWAHVWAEHGIQRNSVLDQVHSRTATNLIPEYFERRISNAHDELPLRVRQYFATHYFEGSFFYLANWIFQEYIMAANPTMRENMFGWELHKWVVDAVTARHVDVDSIVARVVRRHGWHIPQGSTPQAWYRPHGTHLIITLSCRDPERPLVPEIPDDVELEPYGDRINVGDYSSPMSQPPAGAECSICQEHFGEEGSVALNECFHLFHEGCLDDWINRGNRNGVTCPNCRAFICAPRMWRAVEAEIPMDEDNVFENGVDYTQYIQYLPPELGIQFTRTIQFYREVAEGLEEIDGIMEDEYEDVEHEDEDMEEEEEALEEGDEDVNEDEVNEDGESHERV